MDFYEKLLEEISSAESYLEDAEEEGWRKDAIEFQRNYLDALIKVKKMAKEIYYVD